MLSTRQRFSKIEKSPICQSYCEQSKRFVCFFDKTHLLPIHFSYILVSVVGDLYIEYSMFSFIQKPNPVSFLMFEIAGLFVLYICFIVSLYDL